MDKTSSPHIWPWVLLAVYAGLSLLDYGLTLTALATGRMGLSPTTGHPYEGNPVAVWLFTHAGAGTILVYRAIAVMVGALLLLVSRPMRARYARVRVVTWVVLGAAVAWQVVGVSSVMFAVVQ